MIRSKLRPDFSPPGSNEEAVNSPEVSLNSPYISCPSIEAKTEQERFNQETYSFTQQQSSQSVNISQRKSRKRSPSPRNIDEIIESPLSSESYMKTKNQVDYLSQASKSPLPCNSNSTNYICSVCGDKAFEKHFGVIVCGSCRGFFKRSIKNQKEYKCTLKKNCVINKKNRNHCQYCRLAKSYQVGLDNKAAEEEIIEDKKRKIEKRKESSNKLPKIEDNPLVIDLSAIASAELFVDPKIAEFANVEFDPIRQLCLAADKQLASLAEWARRIPHFTELELSDQVKLLQWNWAELLIGGFCYRSSAVSNGILLSTGLHLSRANLEKAGVGALINKLFNEVINKMRGLQIDITEWGCLRAIMLFAPDTKELKDIEKVESIRERYIATLCSYVQKHYPNDDQRLGNLLLRLPPLKTVALQVLEHLFFFKIIGDVPIDTFLIEMLDADNH